MVTVEFDSMGEAVRLALVADEYVGGGLAVLLLDATDPRSEGYMAEWGVLTANVPAAAEWCRGRGHNANAPAAPPAPPEGVPEEEDVSAEELLVPPEGAEEEEPPLSAPAFGCANTYRLRCVSSAFSRPSAVFAVSSSFSPSGLT